MKKNLQLRTEQQHQITQLVLSTTTFLLLAVCFLPFVSGTTPTPSIDLPGGTVTMIATDGTVSYFDIHLSDVPSGNDITNGDYEGWCADRAVSMPRGEPLTIQLHNSYDPNLPWSLKDKDWAKANDILNDHGSIPREDVQDALWYLLCETNYSTLSDVAKTLVDTADPTFIPAAGDWIAIIAEPIQNTSHPWPFQKAFIQIQLPSDEPSEPEQPDEPEEQTTTPTRISHGYRYNDIAPTALTNGPYNGYSNEPVEFNGLLSYDTDGIIISYHWDLGDGTTAETPTTTHSFTHAGIYQVSLTVMDNFGLKNTHTVDATIINRNSAPTNLIILGPTEGTTNINYSYAIKASDPDHDDITYQILWGDGSTQTTSSPSGEFFSFHHPWTTTGTYSIIVTASDGALETISSIDVNITEAPITDNIWIIGLALLAIIVLLALWFYSIKTKN